MIPLELEEIIQRFDEIGAEIYLVGGCVRDYLLGTSPKDYDMTTSLKPDEILELFSDYTCFTIGKKFGTIGLLTGIGIIEITTFRVDGLYLDNRKPQEVHFTQNIKEDLARRDFTMNAMAYHPQKGLVDPFFGQEALEKKIITTVGDPDKRFKEDGLRILRALRFMGQLNFSICPKVEESMKRQASLIQNLSPERIRDEMEKILLQDKPSLCLKKLVDLGLMEYIFPELIATVDFDQRSPYHSKTLFEHIICVVDHSPKKLSLRLAALFHDVMKPQTLSIDDETGKGHFFGHDSLGAEEATRILKKYHEPKSLVQEVSTLIKEHMKVHDVMTDKALRRQIKRVGQDLILDLYDLMAADMSCTYEARPMEWIMERKERVKKLLEEGIIEKKSLAFSGKDIIKLGIKEGPLIGQLLKELEEIVLDDPSKNKEEFLKKYIKERVEEMDL